MFENSATAVWGLPDLRLQTVPVGQASHLHDAVWLAMAFETLTA